MEDYLAKCLDSVIYPELGDYEIIVVNDGSGDRTAAVAEDYAARFPALVRVISIENSGPGQARNVGLDASVGEYILFIDSDDTLAPGALHEIFGALQQGFDICVFNYSAVNARGELVKNMVGCEKEGRVDLELYPELIMQPPAPWNKIFRRSLFAASGIRFPSRVWFEDLRTVPKLYLFADKVISVHRPWYHYLYRPGSITNTARTERNLEIIPAVDEVIDFYRANGKYERFKDQLEYMAFFNQFLTSSTRVNLSDRESPVQDTLMEDFLRKFPDFRANPYVRSMSLQHKLLTYLLIHKRRRAVNLLMRANNLVKRRTV